MDMPSDSHTRSLALGGALLVAVVGAALWFFVLGGGGGGGGVSAPESWDPEVAALVSFVEEQRGVAFVEPVAIDLVDDEGYAEAVGIGDAGASEADQVHLQRSLDLMRAFGLVTDRRDDEAIIAAAAPAILDGERFATYLPAQRRIIVRADDLAGLDAVAEAELVGALSSALHGQYFGLSTASRLDRSTGVVGLRGVSAGAGTALTKRYVAGLTDSEQVAWADHVKPSRGDDATAVLASFVTLSERLGEALIDVALADTVVEGSAPGWGLVNQLFAAPPRTELELIQPWAALDGFERVAVAAPEPDDGAEVIASGDFGAASLYLVLGVRVDPREVLAASLVWAGDAYVLTRDPDGRRCIAVAVEGRDGDASDLFEDAMRDWASAGPRQADASVEREGRVVTLQSCDPGPTASAGIALDPATTVSVAVNRTELLSQLRADGSSRNSAVCTADRVIAAIPVAALVDPEPPPEAQILYDQLLDDSISACRNL